MITKKICVFVDGENLRHSIEDLFCSSVFDKRDYLPKKADWTKFFDWIAKKASEPIGTESERIRTYWYSVKDIDFFPYSLCGLKKEGNLDHIKSVLSKDEATAEEIKKISQEQRSDFINNKLNELLLQQETMRSRFDGWINMQDGIALRGRAIEFRRAGYIRYDLFTKKLGYEKSVDVKLATDLVKLKDIYDIAVIVSGDQDYVPAAEIIKDYGKSIVNIGFLKEDGKLLPGGARRLNQSTDWSVQIEFSDTRALLGL